MPTQWTALVKWADANPLFEQQLARARALYDRSLADLMRHTAENEELGVVVVERVTHGPRGIEKTLERRTGDKLGHRQLKAHVYSQIRRVDDNGLAMSKKDAPGDGDDSAVVVTIRGGLPDE